MTEFIPIFDDISNKISFEIIKHFENHFVCEKEKITLAKIPKNKPLHKSILIHQRYLPKNFENYELISFRGLRRGRSVDILLEEPIKINGEKYFSLNFKGVGALANEDFIIMKNKWWNYKFDEGIQFGSWCSSSNIDRSFGRSWGGLNTKTAKYEQKGSKILQSIGLKQINILNIVNFPMIIEKELGFQSNIFSKSNFSQIIREIPKINIRINRVFLNPELSKLLNENLIRNLIEEDINFLILMSNLFLKNKTLFCATLFSSLDNRYLDGSFVDMENFIFGEKNIKKNFKKSLYLISEIIYGTSSIILFLKGESEVKNYIDYLLKQICNEFKVDIDLPIDKMSSLIINSLADSIESQKKYINEMSQILDEFFSKFI